MAANRIRAATGVSLALTCVAVLAPTAAATDVEVYPPDHDSRFDYPGYISVTGDRHANRIRVSFRKKGRGYTIIDAARRLGSVTNPVRSISCKRRGRHRVRCSNVPRRYRLEVASGDGRDLVWIGSNVSQRTTVYGEHGDDTLVGGNDRDHIYGGSGNDLMRGRGGTDEFDVAWGDGGKDTYLGGRGNDFIDARDHRKDKRIDCGVGNVDKVRIDARERRRTSHCEAIARRPD